ncbi:MAG TPA: AbrB/MazE/SpoVT family DNA-binding domain-containing protein [Methylomirabilota bacterium]|nr:AbrB/MazE/SpoVT family DNA-binding domain-containing protein [Methylomirabilota bacterium]
MPESSVRPLGAVHVGEHGEITVPASYRKKHSLSKGSELVVVQLGDALMMAPADVVLTQLSQRLQDILAGEGITLEKALKNLPRVRRRLFQELYGKEVDSHAGVSNP